MSHIQIKITLRFCVANLINTHVSLKIQPTNFFNFIKIKNLITKSKFEFVQRFLFYRSVFFNLNK